MMTSHFVRLLVYLMSSPGPPASLWGWFHLCVCERGTRTHRNAQRERDGATDNYWGGGEKKFPCTESFQPLLRHYRKKKKKKKLSSVRCNFIIEWGFFFLLFRRLRGVGRQIGWIGPPGPIVIIGSRFRRSLSGRLECRLVPCISFIFLFSSSSWPLLSSFINILASHGRPENVKKGWRIESSSLCCECPPNFSSTLETNTIAPVGVRPVSLIICRTCGSWATCTKQCHSTAYHRK